MTKDVKSPRPLRRRLKIAAFTLFELMVAMPLAVMIFIGTMALYATSSQLFARTTAQIYTTMDAANAIQYVIALTREALTYSLPTENTFVCPANFNVNSFSTTYNSETINGAIEINVPAAMTPSQPFGYPAGATSVSVINSAGNPVSVSPGIYDTQAASTETLIIYRGDPAGVSGIGSADCNPSGYTTSAAFTSWLAAQPNLQSKSGTYLWMYNVQAGTDTVLCRSIAWSPDAVQFIRPTTTPTVNGGTPLPYEAEVNIVSGYYSPINYLITDEESGGAEVSQLSGKCAYMQDHKTEAAAPTNANTSASNNAIQFSH